MAWQKISQFRDDAFEEGSKPQIRTIINWIEAGELYGRKFGGQWYVDPDISIVPGNTTQPDISNEAMELVNQAQAS